MNPLEPADWIGQTISRVLLGEWVSESGGEREVQDLWIEFAGGSGVALRGAGSGSGLVLASDPPEAYGLGGGEGRSSVRNGDGWSGLGTGRVEAVWVVESEAPRTDGLLAGLRWRTADGADQVVYPFDDLLFVLDPEAFVSDPEFSSHGVRFTPAEEAR